MTVDIRAVESAADFRALRELIFEYEESLEPELRHSDTDRGIAILGGKNLALIGSVDAAPAGCVALYELDASTAVIKKMYVRPAFRKAGLARSMLQRLLRLARQRGYTRVVLDTHRERLPAAYRLYCQIGFTECEPYGEVDYASPTFMELVFE